MLQAFIFLFGRVAEPCDLIAGIVVERAVGREVPEAGVHKDVFLVADLDLAVERHRLYVLQNPLSVLLGKLEEALDCRISTLSFGTLVPHIDFLTSSSVISASSDAFPA